MPKKTNEKKIFKIIYKLMKLKDGGIVKIF